MLDNFLLAAFFRKGYITKTYNSNLFILTHGPVFSFILKGMSTFILYWISLSKTLLNAYFGSTIHPTDQLNAFFFNLKYPSSKGFMQLEGSVEHKSCYWEDQPIYLMTERRRKGTLTQFHRHTSILVVRCFYTPPDQEDSRK